MAKSNLTRKESHELIASYSLVRTLVNCIVLCNDFLKLPQSSSSTCEQMDFDSHIEICIRMYACTHHFLKFFWTFRKAQGLAGLMIVCESSAISLAHAILRPTLASMRPCTGFSSRTPFMWASRRSPLSWAKSSAWRLAKGGLMSDQIFFLAHTVATILRVILTRTRWLYRNGWDVVWDLDRRDWRREGGLSKKRRGLRSGS